ncbi:MAG: hypothetical protein ABSB60_16140 [Terracidiphilus sp.]|jgi:hypothetical protein
MKAVKGIIAASRKGKMESWVGMSDGQKTGDLLGLAPYGKALNTVAKGAVGGAGAFLSRICLPVAEEFGLLLRDKVHNWRSANATHILLKAEKLLSTESDADSVHAHPRLVWQILEDGSWTEDDSIQQLWAGLLATSCTAEGTDESNLIFINLLNQLTSIQVRILAVACARAEVVLSPMGWIHSNELYCTAEELCSISGLQDVPRLDREMDRLSSLGLFTVQGGFPARALMPVANITPTTLALQLYARCNGHRGAPQDFYSRLSANAATPGSRP